MSAEVKVYVKEGSETRQRWGWETKDTVPGVLDRRSSEYAASSLYFAACVLSVLYRK